jgi:hypothetical protein
VREGVVELWKLLLLPLSYLHLFSSLNTIPCGEGECCRSVRAVAVASVLSTPSIPYLVVRGGVVAVWKLLLLPLSYLLSPYHTLWWGRVLWNCESCCYCLCLIYSLHTIPCGEGGCCRSVKAVAVASVLSTPSILYLVVREGVVEVWKLLMSPLFDLLPPYCTLWWGRVL